MATLLTDKVAEDKESTPKKVVPFVVGDNVDGLKKFQQVQFMIDQGKLNHCPGDWLNEDNILSWKDIAKIASA